MKGYIIPKLVEQATRKNIGVLNWKIYRLPARGKQTFVDDQLRADKKRAMPDCKFPVSDWCKDFNSTVVHGISTKQAFHNKSPRVTISDHIMKTEKRKAVPPLGTHSPSYR